MVYYYDGAGNKLKKQTFIGNIPTIATDYVGNAVYINNSLSFITLPEGRVRYSGTAATKYMYDFFIKDHLGSTRSVVTFTEGNISGNFTQVTKKSEEVVYLATSEPENAAKENQLFDNIETTRSTKPLNKTATDNYVAKISSKNNKTILGPDITLKVMAQDTVKISAEALYLPETINRTDEVGKNVINSFVTAFTSLPSLAAEGITAVTNSSSNELATAILNMQQRSTAADAPRAYLNYVLYDESMKLVPGASGALQVKNKEGWQTLETGQIVIPQNGFLRVFSNNMETAPISINNTLVGLIPGQLVEEYNYYPYGLVFDQTQASGAIKKTDYLYNGKELQHNEFGAGNGLELEDYGARLYDPQVGRWTQVDPLAIVYNSLTPYNYCENNPVMMIDPDGMASTYNWDAKRYEDEKGNEVSFDQVQQEYGIDQNEQNDSNDGNKDGDNKEPQSQEPVKGSVNVNWNAINTGLQVTDFIGVGAAMGREIALDFRMSTDLMNRIGMATNLKAIYRLGITSKYLGLAGYFGSALGTALDYQKMKNGEISKTRFGYNTVGTSLGIGIGIGIGTIPGAGVGATFFVAQQMYDGYNWWSNQMSVYLTNIENGLKKGWVPSK